MKTIHAKCLEEGLAHTSVHPGGGCYNHFLASSAGSLSTCQRPAMYGWESVTPAAPPCYRPPWQ